MTDPSNLTIVQTLYEAFAARDRDRILEIFDPEIEWIQNEGFPEGGRHVGAEAVMNDVFAKLRGIGRLGRRWSTGGWTRGKRSWPSGSIAALTRRPGG